MRADAWLEELVQLYEYQVEDLSAGRSPRGDRHSFQAVREALLFSDTLAGPARKRLMQAERQFRTLQRQGRVQFTGGPAQRTDPAHAFQNTVQRLSDRLWEADAQRWMFARLWAARSEPRLMPLRLLFSVSDNLRRQQRGEAPGPLITLEEALERELTSLSRIEALNDTLLPILSTAAGRQRLERAVLDLEQQAASASEGSPLQPLPSRSGPGEELLLHKTAAALRRLLGRWPSHHPARDQAEVLAPAAQTSGAAALAIHLAELGEQPRHVHWRQLALQLHRSDSGTELRLNAPGEQERCLSLKKDLPAELRLWSFELAGQRIHAALEGDALLLRSERAAPKALQVLAHQARLCLYLTQPRQAYAPMRLARAAALLLRGRSLEGTDLSAASAARYASATPPQLGQLAARGLDALLTFSGALDPWQRAQKLREAAELLDLSPAEGQLMSDLLGTAQLPDLIFDPAILSAGGFPAYRAFVLLDWPASSTALDIGGQELRLTADPQSPPEDALLTAELPGLPAQPVHEVLTWPLEQGGLALVRHGEHLAYTTVL